MSSGVAQRLLERRELLFKVFQLVDHNTLVYRQDPLRSRGGGTKGKCKIFEVISAPSGLYL